MIYVTGDMHGDESRLYDKEWRKLDDGDILIILGDFGFLWDDTKREKSVIDWLGSRKYTVCFLDGTHENFDLIEKARPTFFKGGKAHRISGSLLHLCRGQIYDINGIKIFAFGGGESADRDFIEDNSRRFKDEMPTPAEMAEGAINLDNADQTVDYILTHEPPSRVKSAMLMRSSNADRTNKLNGFFEEIDTSCTFSHWYFGSMHEDRLVTPKHTAVFNKLVPLMKPKKATK